MAFYVDHLRRTNAPWRGGRSCHLMTDGTVEELCDLAANIGCSRTWLQPDGGGFVPHFDLSPRLRKRAIQAGAIECGREKTVEILRLWRDRRKES